MEEQLGEQFINECKYLRGCKFVPVPVGSSCQSILEVAPKMRVDGAPTVKFMQRDKTHVCLAPLHLCYTALVMLTYRNLHREYRLLAATMRGLWKVQELVQQHCKWLQPVRMRNYFDWHSSIGDGDFFLVI